MLGRRSCMCLDDVTEHVGFRFVPPQSRILLAAVVVQGVRLEDVPVLHQQLQAAAGLFRGGDGGGVAGKRVKGDILDS